MITKIKWITGTSHKSPANQSLKADKKSINHHKPKKIARSQLKHHNKTEAANPGKKKPNKKLQQKQTKAKRIRNPKEQLENRQTLELKF